MDQRFYELELYVVIHHMCCRIRAVDAALACTLAYAFFYDTGALCEQSSTFLLA
jgi:hypothetical protein